MRHFRSIEETGPDGLRRLLDLSDHMAEVNRRPNPRVPALRGKTVCNVFFEDSTRTRLSFETAAKRLSADTMNFAVSSSSVNKGESLRDTVETIAAMGVDAFVIRHKSSGVPWQVSQWCRASVINAGDGWHAHPTQALLDCYTIRTASTARAGSTASASRSSATSSTVALRSDITAFTMLGADVTLVAPRTLLPPTIEVPATTDLDEIIGEIDVIYLLRMQRERMTEALVPSLREYTTALRPDARARQAATGARADHASWPDEPRCGDGGRSIGTAWLGDHAAGHERHRGADGGLVRTTRKRTRSGERLMSSALITGGTVVDQSGSRRADVRIENGVVSEVAESLPTKPGDDPIDATACVVAPGFVDLHAHLREPGKEEAETIETGSLWQPSAASPVSWRCRTPTRPRTR